jgi:hypothetical protein
VPFPGYADHYEISSYGRVRRLGSGTVKKLSRHPDGLLHTSFSRGGCNRTFRVHRLVAAAFIRPLRQVEDVRHCDRNRSNNCVENLEIVSRRETIEQALRAGLINMKGENNPGAKLTEEAVREIRRLYEGDGRLGCVGVVELGRRFGVSRGTVTRVILGHAWCHVD